jgi:hypothetical protein
MLYAREAHYTSMEDFLFLVIAKTITHIIISLPMKSVHFFALAVALTVTAVLTGCSNGEHCR